MEWMPADIPPESPRAVSSSKSRASRHDRRLPDLDRWTDTFRLIYYDQRGRGSSADGVRPQDVTLASDVEDLDTLLERFPMPSG